MRFHNIAPWLSWLERVTVNPLDYVITRSRVRASLGQFVFPPRTSHGGPPNEVLDGD